ncbi:von Willebrand factor A domain-containing protein 5A [Sparganum proliferum]
MGPKYTSFQFLQYRLNQVAGDRESHRGSMELLASFGGGLFDKNGTLPKDVPLKEISVHAEVHNLVADVTCKLVYKNDSKDLVETQFVFPIDSGAAVYNFEAEIGQKRLVAKCRERLEAKQTYQEAVDSGHTAFYLEEDELMGDTFAMKVGNIPPTETAVLKVQYFCQLQARNITNDSGDCAVAVFALPSVLNPRYTPQSSETDRQLGPPTEVPLTTVTVPYKFSFSAGLTAQSPIVSVNSAKDVFELKYQTEDKKAATVALQSDFKFDHDLEMEIVFADPNKLMIAYEEGDSKEKSGILSLDCLTVDFLPVFKEETDTRNEVIFLIDRSGSMSGKNILQAKESLLLFLKSLPTDCRFQIVGFGSTFSALFDEPQDYTEDSMKAALEYQRKMSADMGGTEVFSALDSIYAKKITGAGWRRKIIFLTDGDIGNQTEVISLVRRNAKTTRLFAIGLGDGASTSLVTGVARAGGGKSAFVRNERETQTVLKRLPCEDFPSMRQAYPACPCTQTSRPVGFGGGLFDKNGTLLKDVSLKEISVHAEVHNLVADVTCKLVYKNDSKDLVETQFVFPIDSDAAVYNFEAEIGQKRLVAKCRERIEAKQTYQEAVDSGHTAFYLEEDELMGDTFAMKVGNIPPTETAVLKVQYFCQLQARNVTNDSGDCAVAVFALPSVLNPRYTPQSSETDRQFGPPTEVPLTTVTVPYKFSFSAGLTAQSPIISVNSAKDVFELKYQTEDKKAATIALQSDFKFDHDLEMEIVFADPNKLMIAYEEGDSKEKSGILSLDCLTVDFLPVFKEETDTRNEVIFLIDRSGSMGGKNILQAKESLLLFLKSLPTDCRFQIVGFGSTFSALFDEPQDYTEDSMKAALEYQRNMSADMGCTEVFSALDSIYAKKITGAGWRRKIIFLTDGDIGNQTEVISLVRRNAKTTRLFAIGLGDGASTSLVTGVARAGGGKSAFVRNEQRLQPVVLHILQLALQPFATDVELTWSITGGDGKVAMPAVTIPDQLPNLYSDSYVTVIGLVDNPKKLKLAGTVTLKFEVNGQTYTNIANVAEAELPRQNASGDLRLVFHRQAAKIQILELSDRHASLVKTSKVDEKEEKEAERIQKKIVALSTSTNVISRFTAFVGVDPEKLDCDGLTKVMEHIPRWTASPPLEQQSLMMCVAPTVARSSGVAMSYFARSFQSFGAALGIRACAAPGLSDTMTVTEESPKDVLLAVAELQDLSGFWKLETGLADLLACQLDKLKSAKPQKIAGLEDAVWATALVVAFLKTKVADRRMEWQLMSKKAQTWLASKLKSESSVNELINEAASVLATIPDTVKEK